MAPGWSFVTVHERMREQIVIVSVLLHYRCIPIFPFSHASCPVARDQTSRVPIFSSTCFPCFPCFPCTRKPRFKLHKMPRWRLAKK